jgi:NAD(P)-dependent dehydrogenase (short-subunit alcohol dehydrogenase family)
MKTLRNQTAIVTGGAKRIGAALVRALAEDGWHVVIHCHQSRAEAAALAVEIGNAVVVVGDLADPGIGDIIVAAAAGLPPLGLLINSASRFIYDRIDDFGVDDFDTHMAVNLRAPALIIRAFAAALPAGAQPALSVGAEPALSAGAEPALVVGAEPALVVGAEPALVVGAEPALVVGAEPALVVNLLDAKLEALNPDFFTYTLSKIGLDGLTELTARAYAPRLRCAAIAPAVTLVSGPQSRENFEAVHGLNPLRRGVAVAEIVAALRFIIATPTFNAQTITLDGGQRLLGLPRDVAYMVDK